MEQYHLDLTDRPAEEDLRVVTDGLRLYNAPFLAPDPTQRRLATFVRDGGGKVLGGVIADLHRRWLFVEKLWVSQDVRGLGFGTKLMAAVEGEARSHGCEYAVLDTFSFQARPFYEGLGYRVVGTLAGTPYGHEHYWMRKELTRAADGAPGTATPARTSKRG
jgi:GNAT superfamily N-acetyltransferase